MAEDFEIGVEDGLRLSKRVYLGKDRAVAPPKPAAPMEKTGGGYYLPTAPMLYAVIRNPEIVDNPDLPSYQPYVHGKCDPPALIPLHMTNVSLEVDCYLDTAFVTLAATWRLHCVMASRTADCRFALPMGEQGSILGVDVELAKRSYSTQLIATGNGKETEAIGSIEDVGFLKDNIFTLTIRQIHGGTNISAKLRWSQKLLYHNGDLTLNVPFNFPEYVTPVVKKLPKRERIQLNVNAGPGTEILCKLVSHPLKEKVRKAGKLGFLYDSEVLSWSHSNLKFTYSVSSSRTSGAVLLNPPLPDDVDRRDMFCCYLFPGNQQSGKVFRREVVFAVDISGSMTERLLEDTKNALFAALAKLDPEDLFNVIAFNNDIILYSATMEPATAEVIDKVKPWITANFIAGGGTNILLPLNRAVQMLSDTCNSVPIIFLITDGSVEDEKHICDVMKKQLSNTKNMHPRIYTLGIGTFCNHYFLRMLAVIGNGYHEAAFDVDSISARVGRLFDRASSVILSNIAFQNLDEVDDLEVFPSPIPDLSSKSPLIVTGRYSGTFPRTVKVSGLLADMSNSTLDLDVEEAEEVPIGKIVAKHQIELLTALAWYSEDSNLKEKIAKMSTQYAIVSEYTDMLLVETSEGKTTADSSTPQKASRKSSNSKTEDSKPQKTTVPLHKLGVGVGFGNISATTENLVPGSSAVKPLDPAEAFVKAASSCCGNICNRCCCMCCINVCSQINDQCAIVLTQLCGAVAYLGCCICCCGQE